MPVKKITNAFTTSAQNGMLKVQHDADKHNSRTSLASIFEDLASIRKSILGNGAHDNPVSKFCPFTVTTMLFNLLLELFEISV